MSNDWRFTSINRERKIDPVVDQTIINSSDEVKVSIEGNESIIEASSSSVEQCDELSEMVDQDFGSLTLEESSDLITIEQANVRLSDAILDSLIKNFNGKVSKVRNIDSKDRIF